MLRPLAAATMPADPHPGAEQRLGADPAGQTHANLCFIGRLETPWRKGDCPHNLAEARQRGGRFRAMVDLPFRPGLTGLEAGMGLLLLYWMEGAPRDLILLSPPHLDQPTGVFALRSPPRPNPIALAVTRLISLDAGLGVLEVDALDAFDGTPLLDIKPWLGSVDIPPGGAA